MVTRLIAGALLRFAARRLPEPLRAEIYREWLAELHVLDAQRRPLPMLGFASSLAISSAKTSFVTVQTGRTAFHLVAGPIACFGLFMLALLAGETAVDLVSALTGGVDTPLPFLTAAAVMVALPAGLLGRRWGRHSVLNEPLAVVTLVMLPLLLPFVLALRIGWDELLSGAIVWLPGLALLLLVTAAPARKGRVRTAWTVGIAAWLGILELAVMAAFLPVGNGHALTYEHASLWLPVALTGWRFGVVGDDELVHVAGGVLGMPQLCLVLGVYAMAYVFGAVGKAHAHGQNVKVSARVL